MAVEDENIEAAQLFIGQISKYELPSAQAL